LPGPKLAPEPANGPIASPPIVLRATISWYQSVTIPPRPLWRRRRYQVAAAVRVAVAVAGGVVLAGSPDPAATVARSGGGDPVREAVARWACWAPSFATLRDIVAAGDHEQIQRTLHASPAGRSRRRSAAAASTDATPTPPITSVFA
jgi:hypothetical protein